MSATDNQRLVEQIYAAFGRGDLPFILNALALDVDWRHPQPAKIPWGGVRRGREAVAQFFAALAQHLTVEEFQPHTLLAAGDQVVVLGQERMRVKSTGRVYTVEWAHVWTLRGGQVTAFCEYTDTAAILAALRGDSNALS